MGPDTLADSLALRKAEGRQALVVYLMADARRRAAMRPLARACRTAGVSALEIGFPFSDPVADGPILQAAASRALQHGTRWSDLLDTLEAVSRELPAAVMTYANPVWHHGLRSAMTDIAGAGGSGLIVPDLSFEESAPWRREARRAGVALVQMGSPATAASRLQRLAGASDGFLYLVSRYGTTGRGVSSGGPSLRNLVSVARASRPDLPVLVGFGVRTAADVHRAAATGADGAVVGSVIEERLARSLEPAALGRFRRTWTAAAG